METPLVLLYTANIRGDLNLLPRLYTFIRALRRDQTDGTYSVLVDLGLSCVLDVWHCDVTQGRSTLLVLDAMGYDAANITDVLTPANREKFAEQVAVNLVDAEHPLEKDRVRFVVRVTPHPPAPSPLMGEGEKPATDQGTVFGSNDVGRGDLAGRPYGDGLTVNLNPVESTRLDNGVLRLASVARGQVGIARLDDNGLHHEIRLMPNDMPPDATIAGVVDFVISEARYSQKKHSGNSR